MDDVKPDFLLQMVVKLSTTFSDATDRRIETGITLHVGGLLVTGHIITARDFLMDHPLTDKMLEVKEMLDKREPSEKQGEENDLPEFIHLRDAHFLVPGQRPIPTNDAGVFWRGRIADIAGFSFGILKEGTGLEGTQPDPGGADIGS